MTLSNKPSPQKTAKKSLKLQTAVKAGGQGIYDRRDISIILNDNAANEVRRWK